MCKTVRFSGIYGLYVNNGVQKTYFFGFGYWRPWVRVPPLRPKLKDCLPRQSFFLFLAGLEPKGSPTARKHSHCASVVTPSFNSLFTSGASGKTVINCFSLAYPPLRPKRPFFDGLFLFCRSRRGREHTSRIFTMLALGSLLIFVRILPVRELGSHSPRRARRARS